MTFICLSKYISAVFPPFCSIHYIKEGKKSFLFQWVLHEPFSSLVDQKDIQIQIFNQLTKFTTSFKMALLAVMCAWRSNKEKIPYFEICFSWWFFCLCICLFVWWVFCLFFGGFFWQAWTFLISLFCKVPLRQIKYEDPYQNALGFDKSGRVLCSLQHGNGWHWNEKVLDNE